MAFPVNSVKSQFPVFSHHPELVYLDNAATSQKPHSVIRAIADFYEKENANIHRGLYPLSVKATGHFEDVRKKVAALLNIRNDKCIAFTSGTTESINIVANGFVRNRLHRGDNVLISGMEHHANLIPWQQLCQEKGATLNTIPLTNDGSIDLSAMRKLLTEKTRLVAVSHISNVLGTINPIEEIVALAHRKHIPVLIDAAQSAGHYPLDLERLDADFVAFSGHKMFGPFGTGVLFSKAEHHPEILPVKFGGGAIVNTTYERTDFREYPFHLEAGTPNVSGVVGLGAAIDFVRQFDLKVTSSHLRGLAALLKEKMRSNPDIELVGNPETYSGIVSFQVKNIHPHDVATILAGSNIAVRAGHHCAQPLLESMGLHSAVRVSFAIYNSTDDVDRVMEALKEIKKFWS